MLIKNERIMKSLHIITPVKDSIETTLDTIKAIMSSRISVPYTYTIFNDNSTAENTEILKKASAEYGFTLVNISEITDHPSPNYLMVLQRARKEALSKDAGLMIIESDVTVEPDTIQSLYEETVKRTECGIAASVTVDANKEINYPYGFAKGRVPGVYDEKRHCSFCCSLLTPALLNAFDFDLLDPNKNWYDVTISHESIKLGLRNYLFTNLPVLHRPHNSRPWKQLKYKNPLKYYWLKFTKGLDKI